MPVGFGDQGEAVYVRPLTAHQSKVMDLLLDGKTPYDVSDVFGITPESARMLIFRCQRILGCRSRVSAIHRYFQERKSVMDRGTLLIRIDLLEKEVERLKGEVDGYRSRNPRKSQGANQ